MLPLALLAGFLGAGKTTFLTSYAKRLAGRKIVFLVNEFAATDVDSPLLAGCGEVIGISGGSIFCRCKVTDFIRELSSIAARFPEADGVVVEASGMADPSAARSLLDEAGLDRAFRYSGTVTLVDPGTLPKILDTLPAAEKQVAAADLVVVTKADLHDEAALLRCDALVRGINPAVRIIRAVRGACAVDPLRLDSQRWVDGVVAPCVDPLLVPIDVACPLPIALDILTAGLQALGDGLHRAKGFVRTAHGWAYVDWSAGRLTVEAGREGPAGLALIVAPDHVDQARRCADTIRDGGGTT